MIDSSYYKVGDLLNCKFDQSLLEFKLVVCLFVFANDETEKGKSGENCLVLGK